VGDLFSAPLKSRACCRPKFAHIKISITIFSTVALRQRLMVCTLRFMLDFEKLAITIFE